MYRAIVRFADLQDGKRIYEPGEVFPRLGLVVSEERCKALSGRDNPAGYPLIREVEDKPAEPVKEKPVDEKPVKKTVRKKTAR